MGSIFKPETTSVSSRNPYAETQVSTGTETGTSSQTSSQTTDQTTNLLSKLLGRTTNQNTGTSGLVDESLLGGLRNFIGQQSLTGGQPGSQALTGAGLDLLADQQQGGGAARRSVIENYYNQHAQSNQAAAAAGRAGGSDFQARSNLLNRTALARGLADAYDQNRLANLSAAGNLIQQGTGQQYAGANAVANLLNTAPFAKYSRNSGSSTSQQDQTQEEITRSLIERLLGSQFETNTDGTIKTDGYRTANQVVPGKSKASQIAGIAAIGAGLFSGNPALVAGGAKAL